MEGEMKIASGITELIGAHQRLAPVSAPAQRPPGQRARRAPGAPPARLAAPPGGCIRGR
jgi:hypothetical protein